MNTTDVAKAFSSCLKRVKVVADILYCKCRLTVYRKYDSDKNLDCETETDLSAFESTSTQHLKKNPNQIKRILRLNM